MSVFVIGETGATHDGRLEWLHALIMVAADAGCDAVKPQWTSDAALMCNRRNAPEYFADYSKLQFPVRWHEELRYHAVRRGLQYGCSVYLPSDVALIAPFVDFIKISSFEAQDVEIAREALRLDTRLIVSTGMMNNDDVEMAMANFDDRGEILFLHCVTNYPARLTELNLGCIKALSGLSDHSHDVRVGGWAVACGAEVIETHFRLDECDPANKDYAVSFTPAEMAEYVRGIRDCETAMGDGVKRVQECERAMENFKVQS